MVPSLLLTSIGVRDVLSRRETATTPDQDERDPGALNVPGWLNRLMPTPAEDAPEAEPPDAPDEPQPGDVHLAAQLRGMERPVPLVPGEVVDLPLRPAPQEFPFHQGGELPVRGGRRRAGAHAASAGPVGGGSASPTAVPGLDADDDPFPAWLRSQPEQPDHLPRRRRSAAGAVEPSVAVRAPVAAEPPVVVPEPAAEPLAIPEPAVSTDPSTDQSAHANPRKDHTMGNVDVILKDAMQIDGAIGAALVDYESGMTLGQSGGSMFNLEVAAAGNTDVVRSKLRTMEALGIHESIQDILITLESQYHLIRLLSSSNGTGLFLYLALRKDAANLAMARHQLANLERRLEI
jgi:hypothetical protein